MPNTEEKTVLRGKSALVSGGTTGIGRAIALRLVSEGTRVLIFGRHDRELHDALDDIRPRGEVHGLTADVSREEDVERVFREVDGRLGGIDFLINNAALGGDDLTAVGFEQWRYVIDTNVLGYLACARAAIDRMRARGGGHIVNIGSISAETRNAGGEVYVATKSAIRGFSASLAKTLREESIRVTLIEPGLVGSDMIDVPPEEQPGRIAAKQMLKAEDIAECVVYCLSQPARCLIGMVQIGPLLQE